MERVGMAMVAISVFLTICFYAFEQNQQEMK